MKYSIVKFSIRLTGYYYLLTISIVVAVNRDVRHFGHLGHGSGHRVDCGRRLDRNIRLDGCKRVITGHGEAIVVVVRGQTTVQVVAREGSRVGIQGVVRWSLQADSRRTKAPTVRHLDRGGGVRAREAGACDGTKRVLELGDATLEILRRRNPPPIRTEGLGNEINTCSIIKSCYRNEPLTTCPVHEVCSRIRPRTQRDEGGFRPGWP